MQNEAPQTPNPKKVKKKKMLIAIAIITVLAAISYILLENPEIFERKPQKATSMYSDKLYSYVFRKTDYDLDVTKDEWYMQLDRSVHYKNGNVSVMVLEDEINDYNAAVQFFVQYFETVIAGDTETYNSYFTDRYYEDNEPHTRFSPQMIYDIEVEQLTERSNDDGTMSWSFNVVYRIHSNDGTFRNDLDSDSAKKLYFELIGYPDGTVLIDYITYYRR